MRLDPRQLRKHLASGPVPLYLVSGDEPLLVDETLDALRAAARSAGCAERSVHVAERGFDWSMLAAELANRSLFAERRLVELRLPSGKPGDAGARQLRAVAAAPPVDDVLVIVTPALTGAAGRGRWVSDIEQAGVWIALRPPENAALPAWLGERLAAAGLRCAPDALALLAARVEGNLLAARQEIDKLALLEGSGEIGIDAVRAAVADGARYDVFQLADAALAGHVDRALRILGHLEGEGIAPTLVLWSLAREVATLAEAGERVRNGASLSAALAGAGAWRSREALLGRAARRWPAPAVRRLVERASRADRVVKGARAGSAWNALTELVLSLAIGESAPPVAELA